MQRVSRLAQRLCRGSSTTRCVSSVRVSLLPPRRHTSLPPSCFSSLLPRLRHHSTLALGDCPGCGAPFQTTSTAHPGYYIERAVLPVKQKKQSQRSLSDEQYTALVAGLDSATRALLEGEPQAVIASVIESSSPPPPPPAAATTTTLPAEEQKRILCYRCFSLQHHNTLVTESSPQGLRNTQQFGSLDFLKTKQNPLLVIVADLMDLPASLDPVAHLLKNTTSRILLVVNKFDLLPAKARAHEQRLRDWVLQQCKECGFSTHDILHVSFISARKGWGVHALVKRLQHARLPTDDVYLVGCTNAGKSALVNQLVAQGGSMRDNKGSTEMRALTASLRKKYSVTSAPMPGTTLGMVRIPLYALGLGSKGPPSSSSSLEPWTLKRFVTRDRFLIDTPGVINDQQLIHHLSTEEQKTMGKSEVVPMTFRLHPAESLLLKPVVRIDLVASNAPLLMTVLSGLEPHVTKTGKLPFHSSSSSSSPSSPSSSLSSLPSSSIKPGSSLLYSQTLQLAKTVRLKGGPLSSSSQACVDLSFAGVGWVAVAGVFEEAVLEVWLPANSDAFSLRESPMLPFEYKGSVRKFYGAGHRVRH